MPTPTPSLHRYLAALFQAAESEGLARIQAEPGPAVTISRETGAGAVTIAHKLASYLETRKAGKERPWAVFDKDLTKKAMEDHGLSDKLVEYIPESGIGEIRGFIGELLGLHPPLWSLVQKTNETIERLARSGNVIVVGRGANLITAEVKNVLHVRLVCPLKQRLHRVVDYYGMDRDAAARFIEEQDTARRRYIKQHFDRDIDDSRIYHLVVNTGAISEDEAARLIGDLVLTHERAAFQS